MSQKKILAICGSTRQRSSNLSLILAIGALYPNEISINVYNGLSALPQFNPDEDNENVPELVASLRKQIKDSGGVLICTPEYAMGLPGSLKNLLDWTVSSSDFSGKPVLAITASTSGQKAHQSLLATLQVIEAVMTDDTQLLISFIKTKLSDQPAITDEHTLQAVKKAVTAFLEMMK